MENCLDITFDEQFRRLQIEKGLHWLPWVGKNYSMMPSSQKLFIVGESHYPPKCERMEDYEKETWTRDFICKEGLKLPGCNPGNATNPLIANTERSIFNTKHPSDENKQKLWCSVVFFNLVQRLLESKEQKNRPNANDFDTGWKIFFELVNVLNPDFCLILGKSGFGRLGYYLTNSQKEWKYNEWKKGKPILLSNNGRNLKIIFIKHPSRYFSWESWAEFVKLHLVEDIPWLH